MSDLQFKNIFITGGTGYVGSELVPRLLEKGYSVKVYDLNIYGDTLADHTNLTKVMGDIRNKTKLAKEAKGAEAFIHLACISNDPSFDLDERLGRSINFEAFAGVLEAALEGGSRRFLLASSTSQYGIKPLDEKVTEETKAEPITDYGKYKLKCEEKMKEHDLKDMEYTFIRPATLCGYASRLRLDLSVNILTMHALARKKITVFGGAQLRPALNIQDMARFYEFLLEAPSEKVNKEAFNICDSNLSISEYADLVKKTLGDNSISIETTQSNDNRSYHVDASKVRKKLGFSLEHSIEEAILSIKEAHGQGKIKDGLNNPVYHNVKQMKLINLI